MNASSIHFVSTYVCEDIKFNKIVMHIFHNDLNRNFVNFLFLYFLHFNVGQPALTFNY